MLMENNISIVVVRDNSDCWRLRNILNAPQNDRIYRTGKNEETATFFSSKIILLAGLFP